MEESGPTFEDLAIDDTLDNLDRVQKYSNSNIALQRLVHVKMLAETAAEYSFEDTRVVIIPLLETLIKDVEFIVRQHLAEQFPGICKFLIENEPEKGYQLVLDTLLRLLAVLVEDNKAEVRVAAGEALVQVAGLVRPDDLGQHVLTIVLELAHNDEQEELRMTAVVLLNDLTDTLGADLCQQFVVPEVISLAEDPVFRVRKSASQCLDRLCAHMGPSITEERLLPAFLRLTQDEIWGVRKACCEVLVRLSSVLEPALRVNVLTPVMERLLTDQSKWVRTAAWVQLGGFIASLPADDVSDTLLQTFVDMALGDPRGGHDDGMSYGRDVEAERKYACAFSLPAVALTLGPDRWGELSDAYGALVRDINFKVRRTLSFSLHEMARILGPELAERELLHTFDLFLGDLEEVKVGVIMHVAEFLGALGAPCRESYLPVLGEIVDKSPPLTWRFRDSLAQQLPVLVGQFSLASTHSDVTPLIMRLLRDDVECVRESTVKALPALLKRFGEENEEWQTDLFRQLRQLARTPCFLSRCLYVCACSALMTELDPALFCGRLLAPLLWLSRDSVSNVRLKLARCMHGAPEWLVSRPSFRRAVLRLRPDTNVDVARLMNTPPLSAIPFEGEAGINLSDDDDEDFPDAQGGAAYSTPDGGVGDVRGGSMRAPGDSDSDSDSDEGFVAETLAAAAAAAVATAAAGATAAVTEESTAAGGDDAAADATVGTGAVADPWSSDLAAQMAGEEARQAAATTAATATATTTATVELEEGGVQQQGGEAWDAVVEVAAAAEQERGAGGGGGVDDGAADGLLAAMVVDDNDTAVVAGGGGTTAADDVVSVDAVAVVVEGGGGGEEV